MPLRLTVIGALEGLSVPEREHPAHKARPNGIRRVMEATSKAHRGPSVAATVARSTWDSDAGWQSYAACRGENPDWFFAPGHMEKKEERAAREAQAKAICARCPVRQQCLSFSLETREPHGIWGGLNEIERRHTLARRAS